ncbi:hypothetical protein [Thioclava sp. GXIMD4216]|uniref:Flagellar protein FliS n=1 Tax=Thioclava litoralis TaxID=3076557 RepID=A0ABZ1E0D5_9RHOB|nr:hypothetical protein RPE78_04290 [Thioclava sp. FTW29]
MANVTKLRCNETVRIEQARIVALYAQLGQQAAERLMASAIEDLAMHMVAIDAAVQKNQLGAFDDAVTSLIPLARQVGMTKLEQVTRDLRDCMRAQDLVASRAVLARLMRIGDRSLSEVWDLEDMSI